MQEDGGTDHSRGQPQYNRLLLLENEKNRRSARSTIIDSQQRPRIPPTSRTLRFEHRIPFLIPLSGLAPGSVDRAMAG